MRPRFIADNSYPRPVMASDLGEQRNLAIPAELHAARQGWFADGAGADRLRESIAAAMSASPWLRLFPPAPPADC
jgi:hypothetical protein